METDSLVGRITEGEDLFFNNDNWSSDDLLSKSFTFFALIDIYKKKVPKRNRSFMSFLMNRLKKKPNTWVEEFLNQTEYTDLQKYVLNQAVEQQLIINAESIKTVDDLVEYVGDRMFYVQFKKKGGENRVMFAMLYDPENTEKFDASQVDRTKDFVRLFDLDLNSFRSMKINTIGKIARCIDAVKV